MEFNEKLQKLRKQKGVTQEELAKALFVSRTAVSKWESGRGVPNIESLKATAKFFGVTIDELLSGDELLNIAEEDAKQKEKHSRDIIFGLLDISVAMLFFLPFFGQKSGTVIDDVSLLSLTEIASYLKISYLIVVSANIFSGILTLSLQNIRSSIWIKIKNKNSLIISVVSVLLFTVSHQPYAAALIFVFLIIKASMLIKQR